VLINKRVHALFPQLIFDGILLPDCVDFFLPRRLVHLAGNDASASRTRRGELPSSDKWRPLCFAQIRQPLPNTWRQSRHGIAHRDSAPGRLS